MSESTGGGGEQSERSSPTPPEPPLPTSLWKRALKDPLLHFVLLGGVLFVAYGMRPGATAEPGEIVVTVGRVEHLAAGFARTWQRPPTDVELKGLVDDWVREEIATREAIALGLDEDDSVIRRRLRQKLEFISEDLVAATEPTDAELNAYLQAHPEAFRVEPLLTFSQVYLDPTKHGANLDRDVAQLLVQLQKAGDAVDASTLGDSLMLEHTFRSTTPSEVGRQFGEGFAVALKELTPGPWRGPIASGYGVHLVRVSERAEGRLPPLAEVRQAVSREWANTRRLEWNQAFYRKLLERYTVTVEHAAPEGAEPR